MNQILDTYGERLKYFRLSKKLTQQVLEAKSDVNIALISRYERGLDIPNVKTQKRLAEALGVDLKAFTSTSVSNLSIERKDNKSSNLFNKKEFALRLKSIRKEKGLSQVELSRKSRIYHGQIAKYEREFSTPSLDNSILLADSLGVTIDYLLRGNNTNSTNENMIDSSLIELMFQINKCSVIEKKSIEVLLNGLLNGFKKLN